MLTKHKIKTIEEIGKIVELEKAEHKKVVLCHGCFDLMHPGHIKYLNSAKKMGDTLVVTLTPDQYVDKGIGRPIYNEHIRADSLASLEFVDYVGINRWPTAEETLRIIRPDYYVKGQEFEAKGDLTGKLQREQAILKEIKAEMRFTHDIVFSSTKLLNEHFGIFSEDLLDFLQDIKSKFSTEDIIKKIEEIKRLKILVIGDSIIDDYHYCTPMNLSTKSTAITTKYIDEEAGIGGALCITNHLSSFCKDVTLVTSFGSKDDYVDFSLERLPENVKLVPFIREGEFTTLKRRYIEQVFQQKMFEVHFFDDTPIEPELEVKICEYLEESLSSFDMVIVGDFGHGLLTPKIIEVLCGSDVHVSMTVQTNSTNFGFNYATKYSKADFLALDEREAQLACHDRFSPLEDLASQLAEKLSCEKIAVTLGRRGSMLRVNGNYSYAPIVTNKVVDSIGAGDAFLSLSAPAIYLDAPSELALFFGNIAGGMAANIIGNSERLSYSEYVKMVRMLLK